MSIMKTYQFLFNHYRKVLLWAILCMLILTVVIHAHNNFLSVIYAQQDICTGEFISVSPPLNDLGSMEYIRLNEGPTGFFGGLYPGGVNERPLAHENAGLALANLITPLDGSGNPNPDGRIVMTSVGMSNAAAEFIEFVRLANEDPTINPDLDIINGAQPGQTAEIWADPNDPVWGIIFQRLHGAGLTPQQVQIVWVKNVLTGSGDFPEKQQILQADLEQIARNLKTYFPNIKLVYYSSRTRSYTYWNGLSPEPAAYESAFAVRWMLEKQINGEPDLNYIPDNGPVVAPWLSWGPYLWIDGLNPRSDGRLWLPEDMVPDCTHPSNSGEMKVAQQLLDFFKSDTTTSSWFLADPSNIPTPTPIVTVAPTATPEGTLPYKSCLPLVIKDP